MRAYARAGLIVALPVIAFGAITLAALEGQEVVIIRTVDEQGTTHETRTWIADDADAIWIEAATPARPFAQHVARRGRVQIVRGGAVRTYHASIEPNPTGHLRIRMLLAQKYGWADWWIGLLQDTSKSVAVRCIPLNDEHA